MKLSSQQKVTGLIVTAIVAALVILVLSISHLPWRVPDDFSIQWRSGGGQLPARTEAVIAVSGSYWDFYDGRGGEPQRFTFTTSPDELRDLYGVLRRNSVDRLKYRSAMIYDGDNAGFSLLWGDKNISVWGLAVIPVQQARYRAAYLRIQEFLEEKVPNHPDYR